MALVRLQHRGSGFHTFAARPGPRVDHEASASIELTGVLATSLLDGVNVATPTQVDEVISVVFAAPFADATYSVVANLNGGTGASEYKCEIANQTAAGFDVVLVDAAGANPTIGDSDGWMISIQVTGSPGAHPAFQEITFAPGETIEVDEDLLPDTHGGAAYSALFSGASPKFRILDTLEAPAKSSALGWAMSAEQRIDMVLKLQAQGRAVVL